LLPIYSLNMTDKLLSIVVLSFNSSKRLENTCLLIRQKMEEEHIPYEIIIVDDGSEDNSYALARTLSEEVKEIRAIKLSKNFTSPYAQFAGFKASKGACATAVPDDLQRPLDTVVEMYRYWEGGAKIVIGHRATRNDGFWSDLWSGMYYRVMNNFTDVKFPPGGADGFLADRQIIEILNTTIHPINTSPIIEVLKMGFNPVYFPFDRPPKSTKSRWTRKKKFKLAFDTFFGSSSFPVKLITWLGFFTFAISLVLTFSARFPSSVVTAPASPSAPKFLPG